MSAEAYRHWQGDIDARWGGAGAATRISFLMSAPNTPLREEISLQRQTPTTTIPGTGSSVTIPGAGSSVSRAGVKSIGLDECRLGQVTVPQKSFPQVPFRQDPMQDPTSIASSTLTLPGLKVEDGVDLGNTLQHIVGK